MNVRLPKEESKKVTSSKDVYAIMQKILMRQNKLHRQKEYFWVIGLNSGNDILYIELVAIGNLNRIHIDPVEVFSFAVSKKCKKIILVHNHPTGNTEPSESDLKVTKDLAKGSSFLRIKIVDHLIISDKKYTSLVDEGYFGQTRI
jgi:DNA repair protein RadC